MSGGRDHISFEYFPPKTEAGMNKLLQEVNPALNALGPEFFSVTYGAGGGTHTVGDGAERDRLAASRRELEAQLEKFTDALGRPTHFDSEKNLLTFGAFRYAAVQAAASGTRGAAVFIGSGVAAGGLEALWPAADGFIVGTSLKRDSVTTTPIDPIRVEAFMREGHRLRGQ